MSLRDIYTLSEIIHIKTKVGDLPNEILNNMEIKLEFDPATFYGIDKEFYYMTHKNSYEGFIHSQVVKANVNGVNFVIVPKEKNDEEKIEIF